MDEMEESLCCAGLERYKGVIIIWFYHLLYDVMRWNFSEIYLYT